MTRKIAELNPFLAEGDTLTEAFILRIEDEEKQEICNALNRRTEFKVLRTTYGLFDTLKAAVEQEENEPEDSAALKEDEEPEEAEKPTTEP